MNKKLKILILGLVGLLLISFAIVVSLEAYKLFETRKNKIAEYRKYFNEAKDAPKGFLPDWRNLNTNDYIGIGVAFHIVGNVVVVTDVIANSPADKSGIKIEDRIIMIDGRYVHGLTSDGVSNALRGEKGTRVTLNIYRDSFRDKSRNVTMVREFIDNSERREYSLFMFAGEGGEDLGNNYRKFRGKIYYWDDAGGQAVPDAIAIEANPKTFVSLENENCTWDKNKSKFNPCRDYAKDDSKVFYRYIQINDADPNSFQILQGAFAKDKDYVFYDAKKIEGLNPEALQILGLGEFGKDKSIVVFAGEKIVDADPQSFQVLHEKYCLAYTNALAKDKNGYYSGDSKITKDKYFEYVRSESKEIEPIKETCN